MANVDLCSNLIQQVQLITFGVGIYNRFHFLDPIGDLCPVFGTMERPGWKKASDNVPLPWLLPRLSLDDSQRLFLQRALC